YVNWRHLTTLSSNPFRDVRLFMSTYDAMHPPTVRAFLSASQRRRPLWMQGWGQTETGPLTFRFLTRKALSATDLRPTTRDLGSPVPGKTKLRVVDPRTFKPVPPGSPGVVVARTKARCLGYVGEPERWSAKAYGPWWNTGDIGARTRTGRVLLLDREVDMVPGLSCLALEDVIEDRLRDVAECVILGAPDRLPLPVVVTHGKPPGLDAWRQAVAGLPALAEPMIFAWDEVPRTVTGKVRRLALREQLLNAPETHGSGRWT
ncbi:MAG: AMP-binding protein, partial [Stackebrandtia sp.]